MFVDRFMSTAMHYPCNYGYVPQTLSDDGDPVDVLVITPFPLIAGRGRDVPADRRAEDGRRGRRRRQAAGGADRQDPVDLQALAEARRHERAAPAADPALLRALQGPGGRQVGQGRRLGRPRGGARGDPPGMASYRHDAEAERSASSRSPALRCTTAAVRLHPGCSRCSRCFCRRRRRRAAQPLPAGVGQGAPSVEGIAEYRLANGLQVLLFPDDSKPTTTVNLTYRVGSRHENYGETGMAHLLEHMLFKGTPTHPKRLGRVREARPGAPTAPPSFDRTNYFEQLLRQRRQPGAGTSAGRPTRWSTASSRARTSTPR